MPRLHCWVWLLAGTLLVGTLACERPSPTPRGERRNLLLILIDTCRRDRMSLYGHARPTTPFLEQIAPESVVFEQALSHVPQTLPSTATLLTSTLPSEHGVRVNGRLRLGDEAITLAEVLAGAGYRTGAVVSALPLDARFGISQGFQDFDADFRDSILTRTRSKGTPFQGARYPDFEQRADEATDKALAWLRREAGGDRPFFLLVHYFDPHWPYAPPPGRSPGLPPYEAELALTDAEIGRLVRGVRELGLLDRTLLVVTGDHGEVLGPSARRSRHAGRLEDAVLRVPLLLRAPGLLPGGVRVEAQVGLIEVAPTLLELLGVGSPASFRGRSLLPLVRGEAPSTSTPVPFETLYWKFEEGGDLVRVGVRTEELKYVRNVRDRGHGVRVSEELYDLVRDPAEQHNLLAPGKDVPAAHATLLDAFRRETVARLARGRLAEAVPLSPRVEESLRSLGYIQ
jgi:arylsulfatase A-like enzyme